MTDPLTLTKLIILYMLETSKEPLKRSSLFGFILEKEYTNFFTLTQAAGELLDSKYTKESVNKTDIFVEITEEGRHALLMFSDRVSPGIKNDIIDYFNAVSVEINNPVTVYTNFYAAGRSGYICELKSSETGMEILDLKINVPTKETAKAMCESFENKYNEIYGLLVDNLL